MMEYYSFILRPNVALEAAQETLTQKGFHILYSEESEKEKCLFGYPPKEIPPENLLHLCPEIASFHSVQFDQIDWQAQWSSENSSIYIDLHEYFHGAKNGFFMNPGPGFGDLSHPTTKLVLRMMAPITKGKFVIDLGCGSAVLSLAAIKLGAVGACGIDIDPEALAHSRGNAKLNGIEDKLTFQLPGETLKIPTDTSILLVMNMIYSEQEQAWDSLPQLHKLKMACVTSGVLREQRKLYLKQCKRWGWQEVEYCFEEKWCGFRMGANGH